MGISAHSAISRLGNIRTVEELTSLINQIDLGMSSSRIIVFSGDIGFGNGQASHPIYSMDMASSISSVHPQIQITNDLPIGRFLDTVVSSVYVNEDLIQKLDQLFDGDREKITEYLYGSRDADGNRIANGIWDHVSARFAAAAKGDVLTLAAGARSDGVFAQTELPTLLANPNVTSVDGIPTAMLRKLGREGAFDLIKANSEIRAAQLRIAVDGNGNPIQHEGRYQIDTTSFLPDLPPVSPPELAEGHTYRHLGNFFPAERLRNHQEILQRYRPLVVAEKQALKQPHQINQRLPVSDLLHKVDQGLMALGLVVATVEAQQAHSRGDDAKAKSILTRWARETSAAYVASQVVSTLARPLASTGPVGSIIAGALVIASAIYASQQAGSSFGEDVMNDIIESMAKWTEGLISKLQRLFSQPEICISPLVLDLDGNGVSTRALSAGRIHFDHDNNGFAERSGWVGERDGLLVRDLDGNSRITGGAELFGNNTRLADNKRAANGFEALRSLDSNLDNQISASDAEWRSLRLWIDANADAETDPGELISLEQAGVAALLLNYTLSSRLDAQGNGHWQIGSYRRSDGSLAACNDVWFSTDTSRTVQLNPIPVPAAIANLPNLPGMGTVASLHQVMAANPASALPNLLRQWMAGSSDQRAALILPILDAWTGVDGPTPVEWSGTGEDYRRLRLIERLIGRPFRGLTWNTMPDLAVARGTFLPIQQMLVDELDLLLSAQVDLLPLLGSIPLPDGSPDGAKLSGEAAITYFNRIWGDRPDPGILWRISTNLNRFGGTGVQLLEAIRQICSNRSDGLSTMLLAAQDVPLRIQGCEGDDTISGSAANEWIEGNGGTDSLSGGDGNDVLIAAGGNDTLIGGNGNDLFLISGGGWRTTLSDYRPTDHAGNADRIRFLDLNASAVQAVERHGGNLLIRFSSSDLLFLPVYFASWQQRVTNIDFADQITWSDLDIQARVVIGGATGANDLLGGFYDIVNRIDGLDGNDSLYGASLDDQLIGGAGHDNLVGHEGHDLLIGGSGHDRLQADDGNDTLIAAGGNDTLIGGAGNDLYQISRGGWRTVISDLETSPGRGNADVLKFIDLAASEVTAVGRDVNSLLIRFSSTDQVVLSNYFLGADWRVDSFHFSDGLIWGATAISERLSP